MIVISDNPEKTVAICTDIDLSSDHSSIGTFTPRYLLEWAKLLVEQYGNDSDTTVMLYRHNSSTKSSSAIVASDDGEEPFIVVVGHEVE